MAAPVAGAQLALRLNDRRERAWLLVDLLVVAWLIWLFDALNNLAPVRQALAERNGDARARPRALAAPRPGARARPRGWRATTTLSQVVVFWYENVHIAVTLAVFAWLWWRRADVLGVMRCELVIVNLIALAVFWSFPGGAAAHARRRIRRPGRARARSAGVAARRDGARLNQFCSMPSLHIAWATWCSIAVWK